MADRNGIIDKIKALLAKTTANGATEFEMMAALDKASAMMGAYDITDDEVKLAKDEAAILHAEAPDISDTAFHYVADQLRRRAVLRRDDLSLPPRGWPEVHRHAERRPVRLVAARQSG